MTYSSFGFRPYAEQNLTTKSGLAENTSIDEWPSKERRVLKTALRIGPATLLLAAQLAFVSTSGAQEGTPDQAYHSAASSSSSGLTPITVLVIGLGIGAVLRGLVHSFRRETIS